jgi:hypothetical protein
MAICSTMLLLLYVTNAAFIAIEKNIVSEETGCPIMRARKLSRATREPVERAYRLALRHYPPQLSYVYQRWGYICSFGQLLSHCAFLDESVT